MAVRRQQPGREKDTPGWGRSSKTASGFKSTVRKELTGGMKPIDDGLRIKSRRVSRRQAASE